MERLKNVHGYTHTHSPSDSHQMKQSLSESFSLIYMHATSQALDLRKKRERERMYECICVSKLACVTSSAGVSLLARNKPRLLFAIQQIKSYASMVLNVLFMPKS